MLSNVATSRLLPAAVRITRRSSVARSSRPYSVRTMASDGFYALSAKTLKGDSTVDFSAFKGKAVLVVNVASHCGFTSQYSGLQKLYDSYKDKGLEIIGFPCNQFGGQEPGGADEIASFCTRTYSVTFPIMEKVDVNGSNTHPVYAYLKGQRKQFMMEGIKWNFEKFLVDRNGNVVERYSSMATPDYIAPAVEKVLAQA